MKFLKDLPLFTSASRENPSGMSEDVPKVLCDLLLVVTGEEAMLIIAGEDVLQV